MVMRPLTGNTTLFAFRSLVVAVLVLTVPLPSSHAQGRASKLISSAFYPLNVGDYWEYFDIDWYGRVQDTTSELIEKDSLLLGTVYKKIVSRSFRWKYSGTRFHRADSIGDVYSFDTASGNERLLYRLSDTSKSVWFTGNMKARFDSSAIKAFLGSPRRVLMISYFGRDDTTYTRSLFGEWLAEGIGSVISGNEYSRYSIKGCRISGVIYGTITSAEPTPSPLPAPFVLHQNYPNPFNPTTTIPYVVPRRSPVTLIVYNILGERIATLVDETKAPGAYEVIFDGSKFASGVYFCRMNASNYTLIRKLVMTK
jgi:hypothetical protein